MDDYKTMTIEALEARKAAIAVEVDQDGADLDALQAEARAINEELEARKANETKRAEIRKAVAAGAGKVTGMVPAVGMTDEERRAAEFVKSGRMEMRALLSTGNIAKPQNVGGINELAEVGSGIVDDVHAVALTGVGAWQVAYKKTDAEAADVTDGQAVGGTGSTYDYVTLNPSEWGVLDEISKQVAKLTPLGYQQAIERSALIALRKRAAGKIVAAIQASTLAEKLYSKALDANYLRGLRLGFRAIEGLGNIVLYINQLWDLIGDTAAKANNWTDIAGYWNTDPTEVEKWDHAVRSTSNSFSDFETIISRLSLGGKEKKIAEMLGISDVNYESQWDYAIACMEQISRMTKDGTLPDNFWEEIFGEKRATKAMDIINDWDDIQQNLAEFDPENGGFGIDEEETAAMNQLKMDMDELTVKWEALKDKVAAGLGVIAADLLVNVSGGLDALNDYLNADTEEERQAAIQKLETNVRELFEKVAAAIEAGLEVLAQVGRDLQNSDDPIVQAIGNILTGITDALGWLVDNQDSVVDALKAIFGAWLVAKLAGIAGQLTSIVADIQTIQMFKGWSAGGAASGAASGAANTAGSAAAAGGASSVLSNLGMSFGMAGGASVAVPAAVLAAAGYAGYRMIDANLHDAALNAVYGEDGIEGNVIGTMSDESLRRAWDYYRLYSDESMTGTDEAIEARERLLESLSNDGIDLSEQAVSLLENTFDNALMGNDIDGLVDQLEQRHPDFFSSADAMNAASFAVEDTVNRLMLGSNQQASQQGLTSEDVGFFKGLPGQLRQALFSRIDGLRVTMDGEVVGRIVAPAVSRLIAREATQ